MNEATLLYEVVGELEKKGYSRGSFVYNIDSSKNVYPCHRLSNASKNGSGKIGKCDIVLYSKEKNLIVLLELKKDANKHGSVEDPNIQGKAIPGALHYLKIMWENGNKRLGEDIIAIAISGTDPLTRKYSMYGICTAQFSENYKILSESSLLSYNDAMERMYSFDNIKEINAIKSGYITNFFISIRKLNSLSLVIPPFQRKVNEFHKEEIYNSITDEYKKKKTITVVGTLVLSLYNGKYCVIDGQHRIAAYTDLLKIIDNDFNVSVQFIYEIDQERVKGLYLVHNRVKDATQEEKKGEEINWSDKLALSIIEQIGNKYKFKSGSKIISDGPAPCMSLSKTCKDLALFFEDHQEYKNKAPDDIFNQIILRNEYYARNPPLKHKTNNSLEYKTITLSKAENAKCWLGLVNVSDWFK